MDVLQMHIEVKQRLQKVGIETQDFFFDQEIDLALNKAMIRKTKELVNKSFEDTQVLTSYLSPLLTKNKTLQVYVPQTTEDHYDDGMVYSIYPSNLLFLVNDRSLTTLNPCGSITDKEYESITEYRAVIPFPTTNLGTSPYYSRVLVSLDGTEIYNKTDEITGVGSTRYKFPIIEDILFNVNRNASDYEVYWETYRGTYYPESFIFVSKNSAYNGQAFSMSIYQSDKTTIDATTTQNITGTVYRTYSSSFTVTNGVSKQVPNRKTESERVYDYINNPFYKPKSTEPLSSEASGVLYIYEGKNFIITNVKIDYIRKPRQISLPLNQSCELAESTHDEIVDLAVELLKLDIKDPSYNANVQENEIRHQK